MLSKFDKLKDLKSAGSQLLDGASKAVDAGVQIAGKGKGLISNFDPSKIDISALQGQLTDGLYGVMDDAFGERKADSDNSQFTASDVDTIVKGYAQKNMMLAAASSLVPGPLGILSSIPQLVMNMRNQMSMIYDLSCAYNKEDFISRDLLLDLPIAALGGQTNLAALQSAGNLEDSPADMLKGKAADLGEALIKRSLKTSVLQMIPIAGPVLMGTWSKIATSKISQSSLNFLDDGAVYSDPVIGKKGPDSELTAARIKALINLIEANGEIHDDQIEFIETLIGAADLPAELKTSLLTEAMKTGSNFDIDFDLVSAAGEGDDMLMELVLMARRSGSVDDMERDYIYQVAKALTLPRDFVDSLLE